jgi:hypothetical protein
MPAKTIFLQVLADALIPLLGFYLWDWSLYFIFLFFVADELVDACFMLLKSKKIVVTQNNTQLEWFKQVSFSSLLLSGEIILLHAMVYMCDQKIDFSKEILDFLLYKDMGIEQGYILLPLLIFVGFQRYKLEFLVPKVYSKITLFNLWNGHRKRQYFLLSFMGICIGLISLGLRNEQVFLWFFITAIASFDFLHKKTNT